MTDFFTLEKQREAIRAKQMTPRGIRNHNPGNLRVPAGRPWTGFTGADGDGFCVFSEPFFGIRALAKQLLRYYNTYHLRTVGSVIARYAPTKENNTAAYVSFMCLRLMVEQDEGVNMNEKNTLYAFVLNIINYENGNNQPYEPELINSAVEAAMRKQ